MHFRKKKHKLKLSIVLIRLTVLVEGAAHSYLELRLTQHKENFTNDASLWNAEFFYVWFSDWRSMLWKSMLTSTNLYSTQGAIAMVMHGLVISVQQYTPVDNWWVGIRPLPKVYYAPWSQDFICKLHCPWDCEEHIHAWVCSRGNTLTHKDESSYRSTLSLVNFLQSSALSWMFLHCFFSIHAISTSHTINSASVNISNTQSDVWSFFKTQACIAASYQLCCSPRTGVAGWWEHWALSVTCRQAGWYSRSCT